MLGAIFGSDKKPEAGSPAPAKRSAPSRARLPLTPSAFDRMFPPGNDNE